MKHTLKNKLTTAKLHKLVYKLKKSVTPLELETQLDYQMALKACREAMEKFARQVDALDRRFIKCALYAGFITVLLIASLCVNLYNIL